jgi:membrane-associated phospholipid phosphatase
LQQRSTPAYETPFKHFAFGDAGKAFVMSNDSMIAPRLTTWLGWLLVTAVLVTICYFFLDRPIAYFSNSLHRPPGFIWMQKIPEWFRIFAPICLMAVGVYALTGRALAKPIAVLFLASLSLVASGVIKDQLKIVFGRYWPDTWTHNNPSLIGNGSYGFHPFELKPFSSWYESFPSGHTTATCAVIGVLWFCWPKFRWLYVLIVLTVVIGLLGANYHFLGDIFGGAFLGLSSGWIAVRLWEAGGATVTVSKPVSPPPKVAGETAGARETSTATGAA